MAAEAVSPLGIFFGNHEHEGERRISFSPHTHTQLEQARIGTVLAWSGKLGYERKGKGKDGKSSGRNRRRWKDEGSSFSSVHFQNRIESEGRWICVVWGEREKEKKAKSRLNPFCNVVALKVLGEKTTSFPR